MVGYALAVQYQARITKWVVIDAPLPGIGNWEEIKQSPLLWHFNFRGPDEERLVAGRHRGDLRPGAVDVTAVDVRGQPVPDFTPAWLADHGLLWAADLIPDLTNLETSS